MAIAAVSAATSGKAACERAGVDPVFEVYEGDPFAFVVASNINRRHLSAGQQAMGIAISLTEQGKRQDGRFAYGSVREATANTQNSGNLTEYVRMAGVVVDNDYPTARLVLRVTGVPMADLVAGAA